MKNVFNKKIVYIFLFVFFSLVFFLLHFIFLNDNEEKITIRKVEEKNYLKENFEVFEKYGVINSTYYVIDYKNSTFSCEKIFFRDSGSLLKSLEAANLSVLKVNEIIFLETNERVTSILIKEVESAVYYCVSYNEKNKEVVKNILIRLFNIK